MRKRTLVRRAQEAARYASTIGIANAQPIRALKHMLRRALERMCSLDGQVIVDVDGQRMSVPDPRYLWVYASYEPYTTELFKKAVTAGQTVLDVGACFGYYSLLAAQRVGKSGRVYAFEPTPDNYAVLRRNIELNGWDDTVVAVPKAVSSHAGDMSLHLSSFRENNSLSGLPLFATTRALPVEAVTIDEFLDDEPVAVIKMDVEGYEPYALDGMTRTIRKSTELTLFTELNVACLQSTGVQPERFLSQLDSVGFDVQLIDDEEHKLLPVTTANLVKAEAYPSRYSNLLCLQRPHR